VRSEPADPRSLERAVRQILADRISGNQAGLWLLLPEHLRLGTWDLLCRWTGGTTETVEPRLALHLIHEAALCLRDLRHHRTLSQKGFEVANGLPFVPTDQAVHDLLEARTVADSERLQVALGKLRRVNQHFHGRLLILDPHRLNSFSQRQMRRRQSGARERPAKVGQSFFCLDAHTQQPLAFTLSSSAPEVSQTTPPLLALAAAVLNPAEPPQVLADKEHFRAELIDAVVAQGGFDLLIAMPHQPELLRQWRALPAHHFHEHWPGYAIAKLPYQLRHSRTAGFQFIQRTAVRGRTEFQGFYSTADRDPQPELTVHYPQRWHIEEFFKTHQALGWSRAGTLNLNLTFDTQGVGRG